MLVLTRKKSERIIIVAPDGTKIYATVVEFRSGGKDRGPRVRIGVDAPMDWLIHREEVYEAILRDGAQREFPGKPHHPTPAAGDAPPPNDPASAPANGLAGPATN